MGPVIKRLRFLDEPNNTGLTEHHRHHSAPGFEASGAGQETVLIPILLTLPPLPSRRPAKASTTHALSLSHTSTVNTHVPLTNSHTSPSGALCLSSTTQTIERRTGSFVVSWTSYHYDVFNENLIPRPGVWILVVWLDLVPVYLDNHLQLSFHSLL